MNTLLPLRSRAGLLVLGLLLAPLAAFKPKDKAPPPPVEAPAPPPVEAPAPPPPPEEPPAPEPPRPNADLKVTMTFADGRSVAGRVVRIERGEDFYAEKGWTDAAAKLTLTLEGGGTEAEKPWTELSGLDIKYGARSDIDCVYDSEYTPWMYTCTLKTTSSAKTKDGKAWTVATRYKWRFTFDDGRVEEFYVFKYPMRRQDSAEVELGGAGENMELYAALQQEIVQGLPKALVRIVLQ